MKQTNDNALLSFCNFLIDAAPSLDMSTRSTMAWGQPDFPSEDDYN